MDAAKQMPVAAAVLAALAHGPDEVHVRELGRRVGHSAAAVGRVLRRLQDEGVVTSRWVGRSRVYRRIDQPRDSVPAPMILPRTERRPVSATFEPDRRPYFLWDIDLSWSEFAELLGSPETETRRWALERLLNDARWRDIWALVTPAEVSRELPHLRVRFKDVYQAVVDAASR
jgi:DNA-binding transcriptional ArsR family regulator